MAFAVLFVSFGWDVCFHYCTSSHTMTSHIGMGSPMHAQCFGHAQCSEESHEHHPMATHFDAKGCCDDYDSKIQFTDNFVYSPEKQLIISLQYYLLSHLDLNEVLVQVRQIFYNHSPKKALKFLSGQERIVFFSSLKLNPWFSDSSFWRICDSPASKRGFQIPISTLLDYKSGKTEVHHCILWLPRCDSPTNPV
mgnify:CR=1 FL=1